MNDELKKRWDSARMKDDLFTDDLGVTRSATLSHCGTYRYTLWRRWAPGPHVCFIGLNPSTADAVEDDPTIRRCVGFAKAWGYSGLCMVNLFAFRATEPVDMKAAADPIGPDNDATLAREMASAAKVVAAWGAHGDFKGRFLDVLNLWIRGPKSVTESLWCLGLTLQRQPRHPLYIPAAFVPIKYDL